IYSEFAAATGRESERCLSDSAVLTHSIGLSVGKSGTQSVIEFKSTVSKDKAFTRSLSVDTTEFVVALLPLKICGLIDNDVSIKETMAERNIARKKRMPDDR